MLEAAPAQLNGLFMRARAVGETLVHRCAGGGPGSEKLLRPEDDPGDGAGGGLGGPGETEEGLEELANKPKPEGGMDDAQGRAAKAVVGLPMFPESRPSISLPEVLPG